MADKPEIVRQLEEAFHTIIMDDEFRTSEEKQRELLDHLLRVVESRGAQIDRAISGASETLGRSGTH